MKTSRAIKPPKPQFQQVFEERTGSVFGAMKARKVIVAAGGLPFDLRGFRVWMLAQLGGAYDGVTQCAYCRRWLHIGDPELQVEHKIPVAKPWGGSAELANCTIACKGCNVAKGRISDEGFRALIAWMLEHLHPFDRKDVLVRLAAGNEGQQQMWQRGREKRDQRQMQMIG